VRQYPTGNPDDSSWCRQSEQKTEKLALVLYIVERHTDTFFTYTTWDFDGLKHK
jgi:hypothetical protein